MTVRISVAALPTGGVQLIVEPEGKPTLDVIFPAEDVSAVCALLLGAARTASQNVGADQPIGLGATAYQGRIDPTSLTLTHLDESFRPAILVQMGQTFLAIDVADPAEVARALLTESAPRHVRPS